MMLTVNLLSPTAHNISWVSGAAEGSTQGKIAWAACQMPMNNDLKKRLEEALKYLKEAEKKIAALLKIVKK